MSPKINPCTDCPHCNEVTVSDLNIQDEYIRNKNEKPKQKGGWAKNIMKALKGSQKKETDRAHSHEVAVSNLNIQDEVVGNKNENVNTKESIERVY